MSDLDWFIDGSCRGQDSSLWFPVEDSRRESTEHARKVCADCPVKTECLEFAVANHITDGVWGGTTPSQRKPMFKGIPRQRWTSLKPRFATPRASHGTRTGYCEGCRCESCTEANRVYERSRGRRVDA